MDVVAGDVIEIPHPYSSARIRIVITSTDNGVPLAGRTIAYLPNEGGVWLHHLGAVQPISQLAPGAFIIRNTEVLEDHRSVARTSDAIEDLAHKLLVFARELSGSIGAMR